MPENTLTGQKPVRVFVKPNLLLLLLKGFKLTLATYIKIPNLKNSTFNLRDDNV